MLWASGTGQGEALDDVVADAAAPVVRGLDGQTPDLVFVFVSRAFAPHFEQVPELVRMALGGGLVIGCSADGVVGAGREIEGQPAITLTAAILPNVSLSPFYIPPGAGLTAGDGTKRALALRDDLGLPFDDPVAFVVLPDPFSCDARALVGALDETWPSAVTIGGLASGTRAAGEAVLYVDHRVFRGGCVGLALGGDVRVETVVAQGCRPIGHPHFVTRAEGHLLFELDGLRALNVVESLFNSLSVEDQVLFKSALQLGVVMRPDQEVYGQGDFLIRNIAGADAESGALVVGADLRSGDVVQLHLRDAATSSDDLDGMLGRRHGEPTPAGALMFSCLGRGTHLYGVPNHDADIFARQVGPVPLGGFFCNGELGPVRGRTHLHGYTSCFGLFHPGARLELAPDDPSGEGD